MTNKTDKQDERIAQMTFASVYPLYVAKLARKGRPETELHAVIEWLTGFTEEDIKDIIKEKLTFRDFFEGAKLNPDAASIKGKICGYTIQEIENPLTRKVRYLDKLVDELAKGETLEKIINSYQPS